MIPPIGRRQDHAKLRYCLHQTASPIPWESMQMRRLTGRGTHPWDGMAAEIVQATRRERLEFRFRGARHLLVLCEQGVRSEGDTFVEGLPRSTLRDVTRKLTFVPAGRTYQEWHDPRVLTRIVYFYFDPARMPSHSEAGVKPAHLAPRLFFEDAEL